MPKREQGAASGGDALREEICAELESTRTAFHELVGSLTDADWTRPSSNPAWTVGQVVFHMTLAPRMLPQDLRLIRRGWRLPMPPAFLFDRLNVLITRLGARRVTRQTVTERYDAAHAEVMRLLDAIEENEWGKGLEYPGWDPTLSGFVTVERLFRYLSLHLQSHAQQIRQGLDGKSSP